MITEETKLNEVRIIVPEGMEIDKENSTFECIKFKKKESKHWRYNEYELLTGYFIDDHAKITSYGPGRNVLDNQNVFATKVQAKSALAMAQISQIMANDKRFGGPVTDEEWNGTNTAYKYVISRRDNNIEFEKYYKWYCFLVFHTKEQRDL